MVEITTQKKPRCECHPHTVEVRGSNPRPPTIKQYQGVRSFYHDGPLPVFLPKTQVKLRSKRGENMDPPKGDELLDEGINRYYLLREWVLITFIKRPIRFYFYLLPAFSVCVFSKAFHFEISWFQWGVRITRDRTEANQKEEK